MNIKNTILAGAVAAASFVGTAFAANTPADKGREYIETFGMLMYDRQGLKDLKMTEAELEMFFEGMRKMAKSGKLPANIAEIAQPMMTYLRERADANMKVEAEKNEKLSAEFWGKLKENKNVKFTPSGLGYEIVKEGSANVPLENSAVVVKYVGSLIDGTVFDSTDMHGGEKIAEFSLDQVIPGFREGLQKVGKGGKIKLYIPSKLAYGNNPPTPAIPVNATLIFDVDMLDVKNAPESTGEVPPPPAPEPGSAGEKK